MQSTVSSLQAKALIILQSAGDRAADLRFEPGADGAADCNESDNPSAPLAMPIGLQSATPAPSEGLTWML